MASMTSRRPPQRQCYAHTMQSLRRTAATAARASRTPLSRQSRRYAHDEAHAHGHATPAVDEPIGVCPLLPHCADPGHGLAKDVEQERVC